MYIEELKLKDYRNYNHLDIKFNNQVNVIIGENAQGKTNLLEALYILAFTKSYRTTNDRELIKWDAEFAKISSILQDRKSTRLNSSRVAISYAVFCLKKKSTLSTHPRSCSQSSASACIS